MDDAGFKFMSSHVQKYRYGYERGDGSECVYGGGIPDVNDNCPLFANPLQEDTDGDGIVGGCEDGYGDGIPDVDDNCPLIVNPLQEDTDGDGIGDACEDGDGDGIPDVDDNRPLFPNH